MDNILTVPQSISQTDLFHYISLCRWEVTAWTRCSASCGVGIQTRSVFCMRLLSVDQQDILTVSEEDCREFKPAILQACNQVDCPPAWETEPWQQVWTCVFACGQNVCVIKNLYLHLLLASCSAPSPVVGGSRSERSTVSSSCPQGPIRGWETRPAGGPNLPRAEAAATLTVCPTWQQENGER